MAAASSSGGLTAALLAAALAAWWMWGRKLSRNQLFAAAAAMIAIGLAARGAFWALLVLALPCAWWLGRAQRGALPLPPAINIAEARAILGVPPGADAADIREAHRRLVVRVHPDQGGSAELAQRVNAARDLLLAELAKR